MAGMASRSTTLSTLSTGLRNVKPEQSSALWSTYKSSTSEAGAVLKLLQLKKAEGDSIL
ncbi:hypothetical protein PTT_08137 [Pyrenophora teres f. teres 0-1]|uniref:Uncharacterized protein n=1 Tax=Pyrenophora teres f. teres (strain 0-1) TaxID=861557 RepID=E3RJ46_PYRTT|nr:hypothetical protein PTT_08137 [Pyrenophora teres f. teres 0-1]